MSFLKKLFGTTQKNVVPEKKPTGVSFIDAADNEWDLKIVDLRPVSQHMISTSQDQRMAENAISYGGEDGTAFFGIMPESKNETTIGLTFTTDKKLHPGVLFTPNTMEHKWAIFFDGEYIIFVRSWLRQVLAVAKTRQEPGKLIVESLTGEFGAYETPEFNKAILNFLLISHCLEGVIPAPLPVHMEGTLDDAAYWAFSAYGNQAHFGVFNHSFIPVSDKPLRSHSLFHIAVARGELEKAEELLKAGADINALAGDGLAALHWSVASETAAPMIFLLENGADPNVLSHQGATPIMNAVQRDRAQLVKILIDTGANVNARDKRGFTALHRAAEMGLISIVQMLLEHGADKSFTAEGHTALSLAKARENIDIIKLLAV